MLMILAHVAAQEFLPGLPLKDFLLAILLTAVLPGLCVFIWASIQRRRHPPSAELLEAARVMNDPKWTPSGWAAVAFLVSYDGVYWPLRMWTSIPAPLEAVLILIPVPFLFWFLAALLRDYRKGDELTRQVQLDATFNSFVMFLAWSMGMWLMDEFGHVTHHGRFNAALGFLPLCYSVFLFAAKAKYLPVKEKSNANS
jgi:hypothetical protein